MPVPDPTVLTNVAIQSIKDDLRREMEVINNLASERWLAHSTVHQDQLTALQQASDALGNRLEMAEQYRNQLHQQDLMSSQRALDELKRTTEKRFDAVDEWRADVNAQLSTYPTRSEHRSSLDAVTISIAGLNDKLQNQITAMAALTGTLVTKEQLEISERIRENDRRETRRAMFTAVSSAVIALIGWIITLVLFLSSSHHP